MEPNSINSILQPLLNFVIGKAATIEFEMEERPRNAIKRDLCLKFERAIKGESTMAAEKLEEFNRKGKIRPEKLYGCLRISVPSYRIGKLK